MDSRTRHIIHLHLKRTGEDFYYSNLKAMFDNQELEMNDAVLGVRYHYLKNFKFALGKYENDICVIEKCEVVTNVKTEWDRNHVNKQL